MSLPHPEKANFYHSYEHAIAGAGESPSYISVRALADGPAAA
jgi:hypothetical protein